MKQKDILNSIQKHLARFVAQVKISSLNNEYDINIHSENVVIPILNTVFDLNLVNANFYDGKNNEAIDLIDEKAGVGVQVTSTSNIEKIQKTIAKLANSKFSHKIKILYVYILTERQGHYSQKAIDKYIKSQLVFDNKKHILDASVIYRKIKEINKEEVYERIDELLRNQFSDIYISKSFTLKDLNSFKEHYRQSCLTIFSRINFFGLSIKTKPREIELYELFVNPLFRIQNQGPSTDLNKSDIIFEEDLTEDLGVIQEEKPSHRLTESDNVEISNYLSMHLDELRKVSASNLIVYNKILHIHFTDYFNELNRVKDTKFYRLFSGTKHFVVLGKPGAGKSSFIKYTICKILEKDHTIFQNKKNIPASTVKD